MRFWQAITYLLTTLTLANAAAVDSSRFDTSPNDLGKRQVVGANVCATVGPLTVPNILGILPPITVISRICLCTQAGVLTPQSVADLNTQFNVARQGGILDPVLNLVGNTVTSLLNLLLGQATNQVNNSGGQCRTAIPANGFPTCPSSGSTAGTCSFGCNTGFKICGATCIPTAQVCPTGVRRRSQLAPQICPAGWEACPVQTAKLLVYECVNTSSDLESCGGCPGLANEGVDCSTLPGVADVACVKGRCKVKSCLRGFAQAGDAACTKQR